MFMRICLKNGNKTMRNCGRFIVSFKTKLSRRIGERDWNPKPKPLPIGSRKSNGSRKNTADTTSPEDFSFPHPSERQVPSMPPAIPCSFSRVLPACVVLICGLCGCGNSEAPQDSAVQAIGLKTNTMNYHAAEQQTDNWCWAACIQMALSTKDIQIPQREIVAKAFEGQVWNRPGGPLDVLKSLDGWMTDRNGRRWRFRARPGFGPPKLELIQEQFVQNMPLIVGYDNPGQPVGHAVVITAVIYETTADGPRILRVMVRDPWPGGRGSRGKRMMSRDEFERIFIHYVVTAEAG